MSDNEKKKNKKEKPQLSSADKKHLEILKKISKAATGAQESDHLHIASHRDADYDVISSGHIELDKILSPEKFQRDNVGGIPRGFLCEFFGPTSGGKSSLCMMLAASVTKRKGFVFWADAEGSFVDEWARSHGIDTNYMFMSDCGQHGEAYLNEAIAAAESGACELVVIDSLAALEPLQLLEKDLSEDPRVGAKALMMARACPRLVAAAKRGNSTIIFINQTRQAIGVMYGNPETTPGGMALKFYSSLRVRISQLSKSARGIMKDGVEIGIRSNVQVVKSRFGPPFRESILPIYYGHEKPHPFDMLLDAALTSKLIKCRTRGETRFFTVDGHESLKGVPGFDELKSSLLENVNEIKEIGRRLVEEKGLTLDPDVKAYLDTVSQSDPLLGSENE